MQTRLQIIAIGVVVLLVVFGIIGIATYKPAGEQSPDFTPMQVGDNLIAVEVIDDEAGRSQGLSGRSSLGKDKGMLFVFERDGIYSFWMKDMRFAIDILWIASNELIVHIERNVSPDTYPKSYASIAPARYVLEVPAGWVSEHSVEVGDRVQLPRAK